MKKALGLTSLFIFFLTLNSSAQQYITTAGFRLSDSHLGLTFQQRILPQATLEGIASFTFKEARLTALIERHHKIFSRNFNLYYGAGAHVGGLNKVGAFSGLDGIVGIELSNPINISFDVQPAIHFGHQDVFNIRAALSIRKVLIRDTPKHKRHRKRTKRRRKKIKKKNG